jgi:hypothetical protein
MRFLDFGLNLVRCSNDELQFDVVAGGDFTSANLHGYFELNRMHFNQLSIELY